MGRGGARATEKRQTGASFDYQWSHLPPNVASLAHEEFRTRVPSLICELTHLPQSWFAGKDVLDAGCGVGRHAFGLCSLGANVTVLDRSPAALDGARTNCRPYPNFRGGVAADLLQPLPFHRPFDLVWSYGVLHHTGDTRRAFANVASWVKPGGYLFVMLYGEPRRDRLSDYETLAWLEKWRQRCGSMPFEDKVNALRQFVTDDELLEYFDAVSPWINDLHSGDEVRAWCAEEGLVDLRRLDNQMDHYLVARRADTL